MASLTYLYHNTILLQVGGQLGLDNSKQIAWKNLHFFYRHFNQVFMVVFMASLVAGIYEKGVFNFHLIAQNYVFIGGIVWGLLKSVYYNIRENDCKNLILKINTLFRYTTNTSLDEINMKKRVNLTRYVTFIWIIYSSVLALFIYLWPLISKRRCLPLPIWVPYDWTISPYFELTYAIQLLIVWSMSAIVIPTELFFMCVILLTTKQFELLGWEIKNLLYSSLIKNHIPRRAVLMFKNHVNDDEQASCRNVKNKISFDKICDEIQSNKFQKDLLKNLNQLIKFHQALLSVSADIADFFSPIMFIFVPTIIITLIPLSVIIMTTKDFQVLLSFIPISIYVYFQIFLSCYFGNLYTYEYEQLQKDLYEFPWYYCSAKYRKNMIFFLHKLSMPVTLRVGKFHCLNLSLFLWAVKTILSYCMIVYQLLQHV